jgi:hypothetical protein
MYRTADSRYENDSEGDNEHDDLDDDEQLEDETGDYEGINLLDKNEVCKMSYHDPVPC